MFPLFGAEYSMQLRTNNLAVYSVTPPNQEMQNTLQRLDRKIDELQSQLGVYVDERACLWLIKNDSEYSELALGKARIVEFSEAFYDGKDQRIYVRPITISKSDYPGILLHEYLHWYLEKLFKSTPLWFHEGMAMHFSGQMGFDRYLSFLRLSFVGQRSDLFRLSASYPEKQSEWEIFYLSSSMAIRYMSEHYPENWKRFWDIVAYYHRKGDKPDFSNCFITTYNISLFDFHLAFSAWSSKLRWQYLIWGLNAFLAMLLPPIVVLGFLIRRKRRNALPDLPEPEIEDEPPET
jgi:hypothetical protein